MLYYRTLTSVPDFAQPPSRGATSAPVIAAQAPAQRLVRWIEQHTPKTIGAKFVLRGPLEVQAFRDHVWAHRGPWLPFYLPSYTAEFASETTTAVGDTTLVIDRNLAAFLTADRPDTYGRTVFFYTRERNLHVARVLASEAVVGGYQITLDSPFPFIADLNQAICGFAWLVRIQAADTTLRLSAPDRAEASLGFVEIENAAPTEQEMTLVGSTYAANDGCKAFRTLYETNEDPPRNDMRAAAAIGPIAYSQPQAANFTTEWSARLEAGVVTLEKAGLGGTVTSDLWDGGDTPTHITFTFDSLSNEALAWQSDQDEIRMRWYSGGTDQELEWEGRTPVLFNNFAINGALTGGEADMVCYYTKTGNSKIFARFQSEDFATEHVVANLPVMPLGLIEPQIGEQRFQLRAISTRHTRITVVSDLYPAVIAIQDDVAEATAQMSAVYFSTVIPEEVEEAQEGGGGPGVIAGYGQSTIAGNYRDASVDTAAESAATASGRIASGDYDPTAIDDSTPVDDGTGTANLGGEHEFTAKHEDLASEASGTAALEGEYSIP